MHWPELAFAALTAALVVVFRLLPIDWVDSFQIKFIAGTLIVLVAMFYLYFVDDERRPKAGAWHRIAVGAATGFVVALLVRGTFELYGLLVLGGALLGYFGFRWLKHVPL